MVKKFTLADLGIPSETMGFGTPSIYYEVLMIATSLELYGRLQSEVGVASKNLRRRGTKCGHCVRTKFTIFNYAATGDNNMVKCFII